MEKSEIVELIKTALTELDNNDSNIFQTKKPKSGSTTFTEREINRELHETALNHRLAVYFENYLKLIKISDFSVDIEYNRNFSQPKVLKTKGVKTSVRPDILIHKRQDTTKTFNLLVVETKKGKISSHDINKVKAFILDPEYLFKFGLTISYCYDQNQIKGRLYFRNSSNHIVEEEINVPRKTVNLC